MMHFIYRNSVSLSILWALVIFVLCATPGQYIPSASWMELLSVDKLVHLTMFFILNALLLFAAFRLRHPQRAGIIYFIICVAYGALLELMQAKYFSNRSADVYDILANTSGCIIALMFRKKIGDSAAAFQDDSHLGL
jgi:VanZ family protein